MPASAFQTNAFQNNAFQTPLSATDLIDYFFQFDSQGAAFGDLIVGPLFLNPPLAGFLNKEVLVYDNTMITSVVADLGYWVIVTKQGIDPVLMGHPNITIVNDLTLMCAGQNSLIGAAFDTTFINIVVNVIGLYCIGLVPIAGVFQNIGRGYITEDSSRFYSAEDGATIYVQEV